MKNSIYFITLMCLTGLTLLGCQTISDTIPTPAQPVASSQLLKDSDGDGVLDELDQCPATPYNVVIDEKGCPPSLFPDENFIKMEARAYYDENSSEIKNEYHEQLDNAGKKMQAHSDAIMSIEGHISKREDNSTNQTLSRYRVEGIKNYMIMKYNINPNRIKTSYYGSDRPIAPNDSENSWLNQRIYALISNVE